MEAGALRGLVAIVRLRIIDMWIVLGTDANNFQREVEAYKQVRDLLASICDDYAY